MAEKIRIEMSTNSSDTIIGKGTKKKDMIVAKDVKVWYDDFMAI